MSEDEHEAHRRNADHDPLDEPTQPLFAKSAVSSASSVSSPADGARPASADPASEGSSSGGSVEAGPSEDPETTTWSRVQAPPRLIEEEPTRVLPTEALSPEPEPEPEPEARPESTMRPDSEAGPASAPSGSSAIPVRDAPAEDESTERLDGSEPDPAGLATVVSGAGAATVVETSTRSAIAPSSSLHPMLLERVEPSLGRGERVRLDAAHWRVSLGRADQNDLRLYTASASREHAVIAGNDAGQWVLTPVAGKSVKIDGEPTTEPVVLEVGMNLVMGGDHLRCVTEGLAPSQMAAQTSADGLRADPVGWLSGLAGIACSWWLIGGVALFGIGLILAAWIGG